MSRCPKRSFAVGVALFSMSLLAAACAPTAAPSSSASPPSQTPVSSEPAPSTREPASTDTPSAEQTPSASSPEVVEHELPMIGRATEDGIEVRSLPDEDALLVSGEGLRDMSTVAEIRLAADQLVIADMGPVLADGQSWYRVRATDTDEVYFERGWVPGELLAREGDAPLNGPTYVTSHGLGSGTTITHEVAVGTPVTVAVAATPMPDADGCEIDVTLMRSDGTGVNVATESVTEAIAIQVGPDEISSLFQEEAGEVRLELDTDCSFAATLIAP